LIIPKSNNRGGELFNKGDRGQQFAPCPLLEPQPLIDEISATGALCMINTFMWVQFPQEQPGRLVEIIMKNLLTTEYSIG